MVRGKNEEVSRERGDSREGETSPLQTDFTSPPRAKVVCLSLSYFSLRVHPRLSLFLSVILSPCFSDCLEGKIFKLPQLSGGGKNALLLHYY